MGDAETTAAAAAEARWRNYQHLIWTQQQIQLQIQQQHHQQHQPQQQSQHQNVKMELDAQNGGITNHSSGGGGAGHQQQQQPQQQQQSLPLPPENTTTEEKAAKADGMDPWDNFDAQAAFLGPTLWDKRLPYDGQDFKLEYVDLEEFLTENGIPVDQQQLGHSNGSQHPPGSNASSGGSSTTSNGTAIPSSDSLNSPTGQVSPAARSGVHTQHSQQQPQQQQSTQHHNLVGQYGPGPSVRNNQGHNSLNGHVINHSNLNNQQNLLRGPPSINAQSDEHSRSPSPCGSSISRSSDDSSSSMHGHEFDPRTRIFTEDELKPQPMIKKSKKQFVPDEQKDAKYWARRRKNNMAAKRSRDARRVKENQIAMRACFLEKENSILKSEIDRIQKENIVLKEQLSCCRRDH